MLRYTTYILFISLLTLTFKVGAQAVTATSGWTYSVVSTDITEAGNDFTGTYTSGASQTTVTISGMGNNNYRAYIAYTAGNWNTNLVIKAIRTGNGTGTGGSTITGGTVLQTVTTTATVFFSGKRNRNNVPIQYQISGVSCSIPAKTYTTSIVYTITVP